jgi:hypothetical protein
VTIPPMLTTAAVLVLNGASFQPFCNVSGAEPAEAA